MGGRRCGNISPPVRLHKNNITRADNMKFVTYNNYWLKCYLNLIGIVADGMRSFKMLARAINNFTTYFFKKNKNSMSIYNSSFSMVTIPVVSSRTHFMLSPASRFSEDTISFGIPHRNDLFWRFA